MTAYISYRLRKKVREYFLENSNLSVEKIAKNLNISETSCGMALEQDDFYITSSLCEANLYFLFNDIQEKKIITDENKNIINYQDFSDKEKKYLKGWCFKL